MHAELGLGRQRYRRRAEEVVRREAVAPGGGIGALLLGNGSLDIITFLGNQGVFH